MQEALDTLVVRIVEEKAEPLVAQVVEAPDPSELPDPADVIAVLDMYFTLLRPAKDILAEFVAKVSKELPVTTHAQPSLEALSSILQVCEVRNDPRNGGGTFQRHCMCAVSAMQCLLTVACVCPRPPTWVWSSSG